ncbi:MAG: cupredoxin domain-containing protein [Thermotaleaceae bacterium]
MGGFGNFTVLGFFNIILDTLIFVFIAFLIVGIIGYLFKNLSLLTLHQQIPNIQDQDTTHFYLNTEGKQHVNNQVFECVVTSYNMTFEPKIIIVNKGSKVKLTFRNDEDVINNFVIEGMNVSTDILEPKTEQTIEFVAELRGEYNTRSTKSFVKSRSGKFIVQ